MTEITPELQEQIRRLNTVGQQLQAVAQQRQQMDMLRGEAKRAKDALDEAGDAPVYRSIGGLMIQDDRDKALARLGDELETLEIRVKRFKEQEENLQKELGELEEEIQKALPQ